MSDANFLVVFKVDEQRLGVKMSQVERIVQMVEMKALGEKSENLMGLINMYGLHVPAVNLRRKMHLNHRDSELTDQLIVTFVHGRRVALCVDSVEEVIEIDPKELVPSETIIPGLSSGEVLRMADGMLIVLNPDSLLAEEEEKAIDASLEKLKVAAAKSA